MPRLDRRAAPALFNAYLQPERSGRRARRDRAEARRRFAEPACVREPLQNLDLAAAGVTSIIWATGYSTDYSWLKVDAFKPDGKPQHQRGVSREPGIYFVGLPWLSRRGSAFIWGVWHDARHIAEHIVKQRTYFDYRDAAQREAAAHCDSNVQKLGVR